MFFRSKVVFFFLIIFLLPINLLFADGSIYSLRGLGPLYYYPGGRAVGMGGATIGVANSAYLNWINPASLAIQNHVHITSQFLYQNLNINDGSDRFKTNYANFNGFMAALGIYKGIGIGFGIQPLSKINYEFETREQIDQYDYTARVQKTGGLNRIFFSSGFKLHSKVQLGVGFSYIFGKADQDWWIIFDDGDFVSTHDQYRSRYNGVNASFGLIINIIPGWNVGAVYQTGNSLSQTLDVKYFNPRIEESLEENVELPVQWGIGTSIQIKKRFTLAVDYLYQDWEEFSTNSDEYTQMQRYSLGLEYGMPFKMNSKLWDKLRYRVGFSWQQPYFLDYNMNKLTSYTISAGLGVQFDRGAVLDFAFEYGKRGSVPNNSFEEKIIGLSVYVSGGELWFLR